MLKMIIYVMLLGWMSVSHADTEVIKYPRVDAQVSFKSIIELPRDEPKIKISYGSDPLQFGWFWPAHGSVQSPQNLVVLVHGGCWLNAFGVDHSYPMATALSQAGFAVWSLEYRRTGDDGGGWPGSFADIKLALQKLDILQSIGIDTQAITLMGHSAGGHLALLAATELPEINFRKIIGLAAITDVSRYALGNNSCQKATVAFMGAMPHQIPHAYHQASLIYRQLPESLMLLQGTSDRIVPMIQSRLFEAEVKIQEGAGHFDWIHPGSEAFELLMLQLTDE